MYLVNWMLLGAMALTKGPANQANKNKGHIWPNSWWLKWPSGFGPNCEGPQGLGSLP